MAFTLDEPLKHGEALLPFRIPYIPDPSRKGFELSAMVRVKPSSAIAKLADPPAEPKKPSSCHPRGTRAWPSRSTKLLSFEKLSSQVVSAMSQDQPGSASSAATEAAEAAIAEGNAKTANTYASASRNLATTAGISTDKAAAATRPAD